MPVIKKTLRVCKNGHPYYKSSDCPTCPFCEEEKNKNGFLALLSAPARRALASKGITSLKTLSAFCEKEILALHGVGPSSIPLLKSALKKEKLSFKK